MMTEFESLAAVVEAMPLMPVGGRSFLASAEEIREIEDIVGVALPPDFLWFATSIGLIGTPSEWSLQAEGCDQLDITLLFGGTDNGEPDAYSIVRCIERFGAKLLHPGELFVGRDSFSNMYVLNAVTNKYRFVFLDGRESIDLGATGLEQFLRLIKPELPYD